MEGSGTFCQGCARSNPLPLASETAARTALRLVAVYLAFGIPQLVATGLRWWVVATTEPSGGFAGLGALVSLVDRGAGGEVWLGWFMVIATASTTLDALLLVWAIRRGARGDSPILLLLAGVAGLIARLLDSAAQLGVNVSLNSADRLAAHGVASTLNRYFELTLSFLLATGTLIAAFMIARRIERSPRSQ
jgi:hypothetical protein